MPPASHKSRLDQLLIAIRTCRIREAHLPLSPHPVIRASITSRILIAGQAPGRGRAAREKSHVMILSQNHPPRPKLKHARPLLQRHPHTRFQVP